MSSSQGQQGAQHQQSQQGQPERSHDQQVRDQLAQDRQIQQDLDNGELFKHFCQLYEFETIPDGVASDYPHYSQFLEEQASETGKPPSHIKHEGLQAARLQDIRQHYLNWIRRGKPAPPRKVRVPNPDYERSGGHMGGHPCVNQKYGSCHNFVDAAGGNCQSCQLSMNPPGRYG